MSSKSKVPGWLRAVAPYAGYLAGMILLAMLVGAFWATFWCALSVAVAWAASALWKRRKGRGRPRPSLPAAAMAAAVTVVGWWSSQSVAMALGMQGTSSTYDPATFDPVAWALYVALLAPAAEEVVCRGGLLGGLLRWTGAPKWACLALSTALFAVMHGEPAQVVAALVSGAAFGAVYLRLGLPWSVLAHVSYNCMSLMLGGLEVSGLWAFPVVAVLFAAASVALSFVWGLAGARR